MSNFSEKVSFIWRVADLLRGPYKPAQYGCHAAAHRAPPPRLRPGADESESAGKARRTEGRQGQRAEPILNRVARPLFPQHQQARLPEAQGRTRQGRRRTYAHYIKASLPRPAQIFEKFEFEKEIAKLDETNRLFLVVKKFADIDLHPDAVSQTSRWARSSRN